MTAQQTFTITVSGRDEDLTALKFTSPSQYVTFGIRSDADAAYAEGMELSRGHHAPA